MTEQNNDSKMFIEKETEEEQDIVTNCKKEDNKEIRKVHPLEPRAYILVAPVSENGNIDFKVNVVMLPNIIYKEILQRMQNTNKLIESSITNDEMTLSASHKIAEAAFGDGGIFKNGEIVLPDNIDDIEEYQAPKKKFDHMYG